MSETIAQSWLAEFVSDLHRLYPKVKIKVSVDISAHLREGLLTRELDLVFLLGPTSDFTLDGVELPAFDLAWYWSGAAGTAREAPVDFTKTPVITYAKVTGHFESLNPNFSDASVPMSCSFCPRPWNQVSGSLRQGTASPHFPRPWDNGSLMTDVFRSSIPDGCPTR